MDASQLLKCLRTALFHAEEVPDGWFTVGQLCKLWKISASHTFRLVRKGVDAGIIKQQKFRIQTEKRGIYPTWHYQLNQDACPTSQKTNSATKRSKKSSKKRRN